ncbi:hypothetical protein [Stenotrophomonas muris]|uniref:hypothetical protein n=1 Tax=Stenotrophomonas muris TaxID=2963283 RepID=UPI0039C6152A
MSKHTPGPWGIEQTDDTNWIGFMRPHDGKVELIVCTTARDFMLKDEAREQNDANARLIAAAPELLALLVESQRSIGGDWRERRDAAIAKATGEA